MTRCLTDRLARRLKVLSSGTRVRIVRLLKDGALCVNALAETLGLTQGAVSQHLHVMRDAGLVMDDRRGYYVHYRLAEGALAAWRKEIDTLLSPAPRPSLRRVARASAAPTQRKRAAASRRD